MVTHKWTHEEYVKLVQLVAKYGRQWTFIQQNYFPSRDSDSLRIKYMSNLRRFQKNSRPVLAAPAFGAIPDLSHLFDSKPDKTESASDENQMEVDLTASADLIKILQQLMK